MTKDKMFDEMLADEFERLLDGAKKFTDINANHPLLGNESALKTAALNLAAQPDIRTLKEWRRGVLTLLGSTRIQIF